MSDPQRKARRPTLTSLFTLKNIADSWASLQDKLKAAPFRDVIDYRDFHVFLNAKARRIRHDLLTAQYRPTYAVRVRSQRSKGLNRVLTYFHPADLIVYNLLSHQVHNSARRTYSKNAYFSRSLHTKPKEDLVKTQGSFFAEPYGGSFEQWKRFSTHRAKLGTSGQHAFVVFTDLTNYFETIHHETVKDRVFPLVRSPDLVNLLLLFLDSHVLRSRYGAHLRLGIPQDSFDCSRVIANLLLVPIDRILERRTKGQWTRWMDDISFCVNSEPEAHAILNELAESLRADGLSLNSGKTHVMRAEDVERHLLVQENALLDVLAKNAAKGQDKSTRESLRSLWSELAKHGSGGRPLYWDKVVARVLNLAGTLNDNFVLADCFDLLTKYPRLHDTIFRYCESVDYDGRIVELIQAYLTSGFDLYEEVRVRALECLTLLALPRRDRRVALRLAWGVLEGRRTADEAYARAAAILVIACYGTVQSHRRLLRLYESGAIEYSSQVVRRYMAATLLGGREEFHSRVLSLAMTETGDLVKDLLFFVLHSQRRASWDRKTVAAFMPAKVGTRGQKYISVRKLLLLGMLTRHPDAAMRAQLLDSARSGLRSAGVLGPRPNARLDELAFRLFRDRR